ncbi:MAG: Hcp family type VI secretion system effector [Roseibacillus sp.]
MKISTLSKSLALAVPLVAVAPAHLDAAAYIKFDGIIGEVSETGFEGYIKFDGFKIEIDGTKATEKFGIPSFSFQMEKSSPRLMLACANGLTIPSATIIMTRPHSSGQEKSYLKYELTNVRVLTYGSDRNELTDIPADSFSLNYEEIKVTYQVLDSAGNPIETVTTGPLLR